MTIRLIVLLAFVVMRTDCTSAPSELCEVDDLACKNVTRGTNCGCTFSGTKAKCCHFKLNLVSDYVFNCNLENLTALFFFNCSSPDTGTNVRNLDLTPILKKYPQLLTMSFTNADYNTIAFDPRNDSRPNLQCLNVSSNNLENDTAIKKVIESVPSLRLIDLASNNLSYAPNISNGEDLWMHMAENKFLRCDGIADMMMNNSTKFLNPGNTTCVKTTSIIQWEANTDVFRLSLDNIEYANMVSQQCPSKCMCNKGRLIPTGISTIITVEVNCSSRHLTELPAVLPMHTTDLDVSNNNITNLMPMSVKNKNSNYNKLRTLYADNNKITSIDALEGTDFLNSFDLISLKNNKITNIPHFIKKAFDKDSGKGQISISGNDFSCDCSTAMQTKPWLITHKSHIQDFDQITCSNMGKKKVVDLVQETLCVNEEINYIYYIIAAEVLLLLLLVGKVSYDYWVFKHVGYLPWPASKMPRLPCDYFFEK
ncbi:protein halfway [Neocloeon triangulifer]|uniref:protein halfway n=1 Tax=Neocloeon triangulifer TaxID=2078957 RepID=UPI00286F1BF2|nr:protein halfway [Neocloeon triangulifer]